MSKTTKTDTPLTDAEVVRIGSGEVGDVHSNFARKLEHKLAAALSAVKKLERVSELRREAFEEELDSGVRALALLTQANARNAELTREVEALKLSADVIRELDDQLTHNYDTALSQVAAMRGVLEQIANYLDEPRRLNAAYDMEKMARKAIANLPPSPATVPLEVAQKMAEALKFIRDECDWESQKYDGEEYGDNRIGEACTKALSLYKTYE